MFGVIPYLGEDGAKVWISSRKADNVKGAMDTLKGEGLDVDGLGTALSISLANFRRV